MQASDLATKPAMGSRRRELHEFLEGVDDLLRELERNPGVTSTAPPERGRHQPLLFPYGVFGRRAHAQVRTAV